ncbi:MAG TPA: hypothetical protein VGR54_05555 [Nitrosopumilaceae archaeon]|nr:hypothetical protein [Nitrosopumilaceae archaeon]
MKRRFPIHIWFPFDNSKSGLREEIKKIKNNNGMRESTKQMLLKEFGQYYGGLYTGKYEFSPL